ncbi:type II toxin-antitoxin system RatA family toxin [Chondromyces crocatus]|uniref:Oligoketide cyclase n=1 Tax=Chondromyces crocatus TaxID=52 RepID=A0A0K1ER24_CHOCO|nr:SRPBCC family protein [Chondromyces crocatus]AKT43296.1 oligoketide cyclase [Chondromyces crocatus]
MSTIQTSVEIEAPIAPLFDLMQDYGLRLEWDPFLRSMRFQDGAPEAAVGVRVWVRAHNGLSMEVEYITLRPPEQVAVNMVRGPAIFRQFSGAWVLKPVTETRTRVTFRYHFALRPEILSPLLDPVARWVMTRDMEQRMAALKKSAETTDILRRLPERPSRS